MGLYNQGVDATIGRLQKIADLRVHGLGWAADEMGHMERPTVSYPGDEDVPVAYAEAMTHDPKGRGFPHLAMRTVLVSANAAGAVITREVYEDVKRMAMGPEAADTYLDNCGHDQDERLRRHEVVIGAVHEIVEAGTGTSAEAQCLLKEQPLVYGGLHYYGRALHALPNTVHTAVGEHAERMLRASLDKSTAQNLGDYAAAAYEEAAQYGHIWAHTVWARQSQEVRGSFGRYDTWMAQTLGSMLLFAAGLDLRRDHRKGEVTFRPHSFTLASAELMRRGVADIGVVVRGYRRLKKG